MKSTTNSSQAPVSDSLSAGLAVQMDVARRKRSIWRRFLRHRLAVLGLSILLVLIFAAVTAPLIAPHDPYQSILTAVRQAPSATYILGTDPIGRDILSRVIYGARISLSVGLVSVSIYTVIGLVLGMTAGYYRGTPDAIIMRLTDSVLSFPSLMIIMTVIAIVGPSIYNVMVVLGLLGWPQTCRIVRGMFLQLRETTYIEAARAIGVRDSRIILRHMLPNSLAPLIVSATFGVASAILTEASLSFLGLGAQPPTASWGRMLHDAQSFTMMKSMPWMWIPPGLCISLAILSINFVGDGLRDALDPRLINR
jgi:peptide/nickel transport system permease protein